MWNKLRESVTSWLEKLEAWALKDRKFSLVVAGLGGIILAVGIYWFFICLDNDILRGSLTIVFLGLPTFFILWLFRTHDVQRQIDKAQGNIDKTQESINNNSFFEAIRMLMADDTLSKRTALGQLSFLKTNTGFDKEKIDFLTKEQSLSKISLKDYEEGKFDPNNKEDFRYAILRGLDLSDANLIGLDLRFSKLQKANLEWAHLQYTDLTGANLQGANLAYADLSYAILEFSDVRGATLNKQASFQKDISKGTRWKGAIYDDSTRALPIDPEKEGMVYEPLEKEPT